MDKIAVLEQIQMFYILNENIPEGTIPGQEQMNVWDVELCYKGKTIKTTYAALKTEFTKPQLEMVINSMFTNSQIYNRYKDDIFGFVLRFGHALGSKENVEKMLESSKYAHETMLELFGDDYKDFEEEFLKLRPIKDLL